MVWGLLQWFTSSPSKDFSPCFQIDLYMIFISISFTYSNKHCSLLVCLHLLSFFLMFLSDRSFPFSSAPVRFASWSFVFFTCKPSHLFLFRCQCQFTRGYMQLVETHPQRAVRLHCNDKKGIVKGSSKPCQSYSYSLTTQIQYRISLGYQRFTSSSINNIFFPPVNIS